MNQEPQATLARALKCLSEPVGEFTWFVRPSADNVLMMEFGAPHLTIDEPHNLSASSSRAVVEALGRRIITPTGRWHLFVEVGEWSVETKLHKAKRSDTDSLIGAALRQLDGQRFLETGYDASSETWSLQFDLGGILKIGPSEASPDPRWIEETQWTLFHENGDIVSYTNGKALNFAKRKRVARD